MHDHLADLSAPPSAQSFLQNPYYFMFASLAKPDEDVELHWLKVSVFFLHFPCVVVVQVWGRYVMLPSYCIRRVPCVELRVSNQSTRALYGHIARATRGSTARGRRAPIVWSIFSALCAYPPTTKPRACCASVPACVFCGRATDPDCWESPNTRPEQTRVGC